MYARLAVGGFNAMRCGASLVVVVTFVAFGQWEMTESRTRDDVVAVVWCVML